MATLITGNMTHRKTITDALKLVRWPNLLMAALTMSLTRYAVIGSFYGEGGLVPLTTHLMFALLAGATVLVMAGGYIVNDLYDLATDNINKPERQVIGKTFTQQSASNLYYLLTGTGWLMGGVASWLIGRHEPALLIVLCTGLLYFYSVRYKRQPLVGNLVISVLGAMLVGIVWITELYNLLEHPEMMGAIASKLPRLYWVLGGFALFAFLSSLVREWIKDCEDVKGDTLTQCRTLAVVLGNQKMKWLIAAFIVINIVALALFQWVLFTKNYHATTFFLMLVQYLWLRMLEPFLKKGDPDWSQASRQAKLVMLAGILSMQLI